MFRKFEIKKWEMLAFIVIIGVGIFLRAYHFSDWLHFEIDQVYDTRIVAQAVENGISSLPLLGPTAGGGRALRLGPAFYYLEYASAMLFGNTPSGHAMLVLIFSILSLPLFYFFCRRYFSATVSLVLLSIYASSLYLVAYARFSWSPNVLPFLSLAFAYAFLRSVDREEIKKDRWFLLAIFLLAVITQIHFNAFFIFPAVTVVFLFLKRPRFKLRIWASAVLIILVAYTPMVISDIINHGQNFNYFFEKVDRGPREKLFLGKDIAKAFQHDASEYSLILTGIDHINASHKLSGYGLGAGDDFPWRVLALIFLGIAATILLLNLKKEKDQKRKDFLYFSAILFFVSTLYFLSLLRIDHTMYPRFFLGVTILPFIFLGLILEKLLIMKFHTIGLVLSIMLVFMAIAGNVQGLRQYFWQLQVVNKQPLIVETEDIFPNTARITLAQQYSILDYIKARVRQNGYPVYLAAKHEYEPVFWYHLEKDGIVYRSAMDGRSVYAEGNYFVIAFSGEGIGKHSKEFAISEEQNFGTLAVYHLEPRVGSIIAQRQDESQSEIPTEKMQIARLFTWKKMFEK